MKTLRIDQGVVQWPKSSEVILPRGIDGKAYSRLKRELFVMDQHKKDADKFAMDNTKLYIVHEVLYNPVWDCYRVKGSTRYDSGGNYSLYAIPYSVYICFDEIGDPHFLPERG